MQSGIKVEKVILAGLQGAWSILGYEKAEWGAGT